MQQEDSTTDNLEDIDSTPASSTELSSFRDAMNRLAASSVASLVAETLTLPTDVIKTRLQVQNLVHSQAESAASSSSSKVYSGMFDAALSISRHEGVAGLFRGLQPALIRQVSYTGLAFVVFEPVRDTITVLTAGDANATPTFVTRVLSGGIAGGFGISIMNPTEVLKTKMQTNQAALYESPSMLQIMRNVYRTDGVVGFWAGVWPNICRAFLVNAAEIGMYDNAKNLITNEYQLCAPSSIYGHVFASLVAGTCSALVSTPVDVVKTRFMNQAGSHNKQYQMGMVQTLLSIPKQEGFFALYKGFTPIICRKVVWCTAFFVTYERVRAYFGLPPKN